MFSSRKKKSESTKYFRIKNKETIQIFEKKKTKKRSNSFLKMI